MPETPIGNDFAFRITPNSLSEAANDDYSWKMAEKAENTVAEVLGDTRQQMCDVTTHGISVWGSGNGTTDQETIRNRLQEVFPNAKIVSGNIIRTGTSKNGQPIEAAIFDEAA